MKSASGGGKSSIDFAREAFEEIVKRKNCFAITLDISKYFENLDHSKIYQGWSKLLGEEKLPKDHLAVFKAITKYTEVDRDLVYERLGIIGSLKGTSRKGFLKKRDEIPIQLCSPKEFREKVCGEDGVSSKLLQPNKDDFGIPQGAPISDLIANFYLLDFDAALKSKCDEKGCYYRRYCDDLIIILPDDENLANGMISYAKAQLALAGSRLEIKDKKTRIHKFFGNTVSCIYAHEDKKQPFEYLGFQFDFGGAQLRNGTMSSFYRKVTFAVRSEARHLAIRFPKKSAKEIFESINLSQLYERFGRKRDFEAFAKEVRQWNFWSYVTRASQTMGPLGKRIHRQLRNYKKFVRKHMEEELIKAVVKRGA